MIIGKFKVSSTRGKQVTMHVARVRVGGMLIAETFPYLLDPDKRGHSDPLHFIRQYPQSRSRKHFVDQLKLNGVTEEEIVLLLQIDYKE